MKTKFFIISIIVAGLFISLNSCKKSDDSKPVDENATLFEESADGKTITVTDKGQGVGNYTFTSDKTWVLDGLVFVNDAQILKIEAGTLIKGKP